MHTVSHHKTKNEQHANLRHFLHNIIHVRKRKPMAFSRDDDCGLTKIITRLASNPGTKLDFVDKTLLTKNEIYRNLVIECGDVASVQCGVDCYERLIAVFTGYAVVTFDNGCVNKTRFAQMVYRCMEDHCPPHWSATENPCGMALCFCEAGYGLSVHQRQMIAALLGSDDGIYRTTDRSVIPHLQLFAAHQRYPTSSQHNDAPVTISVTIGLWPEGKCMPI